MAKDTRGPARSDSATLRHQPKAAVSVNPWERKAFKAKKRNNEIGTVQYNDLERPET
jgi:hypothetical protein